MQTHHANSPGRGVAVMASREVLRIRRRCWARIQRLPILGDHGQGHGLGLGRGPHAAGLSILVAFSGICARDQIKSAHLRATSLHRATLPSFSSRTPPTSLPLGENNRNKALRLLLHPIRHHHCGLVYYCLNLRIFRNEYC